MLRLFDPTLDQQSGPPEETLNLIPIYRNPKIQGGVLPGIIIPLPTPPSPPPMDLYVERFFWQNNLNNNTKVPHLDRIPIYILPLLQSVHQFTCFSVCCYSRNFSRNIFHFEKSSAWLITPRLHSEYICEFCIEISFIDEFCVTVFLDFDFQI